MKVFTYGLGVMLAVVALAVNASAGEFVGVPEISAGSLTAAMGLLSASIMVLRARRKK
jgi:hypothetical protein